MTKVSTGKTIKKDGENNQDTTPVLRVVAKDGASIEGLRKTNDELAARLSKLDKIKVTEEKLTAFQPENPESGVSLQIMDDQGNTFTTGNAELIADALKVLTGAVVAVRETTEAEVLAFAAAA